MKLPKKENLNKLDHTAQEFIILLLSITSFGFLAALSYGSFLLQKTHYGHPARAVTKDSKEKGEVI